MVFSQYVIDSITSIQQAGAHQYSRLSAQLKEAAANSSNQQDSYILEIISGVISMSYSLKEHSFRPFLVLNDGRRSFSFDDLKEGDEEIIEIAAAIAQNTRIRAKLFHAAWVFTGKYQCGGTAASEYISLFEETFDPSNWVDCHDAIQCAFHIASTLGKKAEVMKQVREAINKKLILMGGADPLFLSTSLLSLVVKDATPKELETYLQLITSLAAKNICADNPNTHLADETFSIQQLILKRLKKEAELKIATAVYADYYETHAGLLAKCNDYFRAVIMLKKACTIYAPINREKLLQLRLKLENLQKKALDNMQAIPFEFDAGPTYKKIDMLLNGLSLKETIVQLGFLARVYDIEETKKSLFKERQECVFSSLMGSSMMNNQGQMVHELPPLSDVQNSDDPEVLHKHLVHHVAKHRDLINSITLGYAFCYLKEQGEFYLEDLDFLVSENAIVPEGRAEIIKEGLYCGLTGKLYMAMHILLPQTENIFRNLVKICGDTATFLKEDGTETFKPLSALFRSDRLRECYDENIIFTFQSIMDEPVGENLRNLNAHGALDPQNGNGISALYFTCLVIKLLAMYSPQAQPILKKLAQRNLASAIDNA